MGKCHQDHLSRAGMLEEHMEVAGEAEQVLLNIIIRVRDQAIMVTKVMVMEMGGPRLTIVWVEMRVTSICWPFTPGYGKPSDPHTIH
jgi:hypothetical protein